MSGNSATTTSKGGFLGGFGLGLLVVPPAVGLAAIAGPIAGYAAFGVLAIAAMSLPPFTPWRVAGVVAGAGTVVAVAFGLLVALLAASGGV